MNIAELQVKLNERNIDPRCYSLSGQQKEDTLSIKKDTDYWRVFYYERGKIQDERKFDNESDACDYLFKELTIIPDFQLKK